MFPVRGHKHRAIFFGITRKYSTIINRNISPPRSTVLAASRAAFKDEKSGDCNAS